MRPWCQGAAPPCSRCLSYYCKVINPISSPFYECRCGHWLTRHCSRCRSGFVWNPEPILLSLRVVASSQTETTKWVSASTRLRVTTSIMCIQLFADTVRVFCHWEITRIAEVLNREVAKTPWSINSLPGWLLSLLIPHQYHYWLSTKSTNVCNQAALFKIRSLKFGAPCNHPSSHLLLHISTVIIQQPLWGHCIVVVG